MKIQSLTVTKFGVFRSKSTFEFGPGINVVIGPNGSGKSHLLKLLYTCLSVANKHPSVDDKSFSIHMRDKLNGVFRPDNGQTGRLVSRTVGRSKATWVLNTDAGEISSSVSTVGTGTVKASRTLDAAPERAVFLPSREALAMYPGFVSLYENREIAFDETYRDLCVMLSGSQLRGPRLAETQKLAEPLEHELGGSVRLIDGRFVLMTSGKGNLEAPLLAEGIRKLGSLAHLILNGSLLKNGFLMWDEPEANLNPRLTQLVARTLARLAASGVQIFVASHDFLLTSELSMYQEYKRYVDKDLRCDIKFFALELQGDLESVRIHQSDRLSTLPANAIVDEFAAFYERRNMLAFRSSGHSE